MSAREYLGQLQNLNRNVNLKLEKIAMLKNQAEKCTSILSKEPISGTKLVDPMKVIDKYVDLENSLAKEIGKMLGKQEEIIKKIDLLDDDLFKVILTAKYVNFTTLLDLSTQINYNYRHLKKLHHKALNYFETIYPNLK